MTEKLRRNNLNGYKVSTCDKKFNSTVTEFLCVFVHGYFVNQAMPGMLVVKELKQCNMMNIIIAQFST